MGATEISAGGQKILSGRGTTKKDPGRGTIFIFRVWVGRGSKEKKSRNCHFGKKILLKIKNYLKTWCFSDIFYESGRWKLENCHFFSIGGVNFCLREGD